MGSYDGNFARTNTKNWKSGQDIFLNFTHIKDFTEDQYNLLPQLNFCYYNLVTIADEWSESDNGNHNYGCMMLIDTDLEKCFDLAPDYPFQKLGPGECIIPKIFAKSYSTKVEVGTVLSLSAGLYSLTNTLIKYFNEFIKDPRDADITFQPYQRYYFQCEVVDILDETYGKMADDEMQNHVILEYNKFYTYYFV